MHLTYTPLVSCLGTRRRFATLAFYSSSLIPPLLSSITYYLTSEGNDCPLVDGRCPFASCTIESFISYILNNDILSS